MLHLVKQTYKDALENVQRRATKQINGMSDTSYPDRLRKLKLPTLAYRRIRGDMIEIYKLLHGKYDRNTSNIINLYKDHNKLNERTGGHKWKICHEISRLNLRKESFPNRAVNMWNFLPEYVVNAPSVDSFKNRLDKQWSNEEMVYDYKAAAPAGRKTYAPAGTQDLTIEAKACGHEYT